MPVDFRARETLQSTATRVQLVRRPSGLLTGCTLVVLSGLRPEPVPSSMEDTPFPASAERRSAIAPKRCSCGLRPENMRRWMSRPLPRA